MDKVKSFWANSALAKALKGPNRKKILWAGGIVLVLLVAALLVSRFIGNRRARLQTTGTGAYQTEAASVGTLTDTVSATGSVEAGQLAALNWKTSGIVESVEVSEGQQVSRGDVLGTLELDSVPDTIISAQGELEQAKKDLQDFYDSFTGVALANAEKALAEAEQTYEDDLYAYNSLISTANDLAIQNAYGDIVLAEEPMRDALREYKKFNEKPPENLNRIRTFEAYYDAKQVYDAAVRTYNSLTGTGTDTQVAVARANVDVSEAAWTAAQAEYDRLLAGPTDDEIAAAQANVAAAQAKLNQQLIEAPFDGVVTLALPRVGNYVNSDQKAFEIQNPTSYYMEVLVNEMDINKIQVGQQATVTLDAVANKTYAAQVTKVGSIGDNSSGVVNFTVLVEISQPDDSIKSGMTAVVDIETSSGQESLLIPNQAVRLTDGQQVVYILESDGSVQSVPVTLGQSSTTYSEVVQGDIQPGDLIVLNPPTTTVQNNGGGFFFRGLGGGGGGQRPPAGRTTFGQN